MNKEQEKLAELAVKIGVNIQPEQYLMINSPIETAEFAREIAKAAYRAGAGEVYINYDDPVFSRIRLENTDEKYLEKIPNWWKERLDYVLKNNGAVISIYAQDPKLLEGIDLNKISISEKAKNEAAKEYQLALTKNRNRWCVISIPTEKWAKTVFPNQNEDEAMQSLWSSILKTTHCDILDPVKKWREKNKELKRRAKWLNEMQFKALQYKNSKGTDLTVGLPKNHIWEGGSERSEDNIEFFPNIPTEEIFTAPDKFNVNGVVYTSYPLVLRGVTVENIKLVFKDGKVIDFDADTNKETLGELLKEKNASYLGEVALVPADSSISNLNLLFFNTLFDENASCHLALGDAYPSSIENGTSMTEEELEKAGLNHSNIHVDFMIGTDDLEINGIDNSGHAIPIMKNGNFIK